MKNYQLLIDLMNAFGVSGKETDIKDIIIKQIKNYVDELYVDKLGNLIAHKKGKRSKIMLAAHMDEIGLMVKNIEKDGKIRISKIGGIDDLTLLNEKVTIKTRVGIVRGIITTEDISASLTSDNKHIALSDMFIDTGLTKEELIRQKVHIGSFISFAPNAEIIGNGKIIAGKALDDRIGCYILIELIKKLKNKKDEIFFVFTVQEEVGLYGAKTSTYTIEPDWAIAVDVTDCDDRRSTSSKELGGGPTLTIKDAEMISNPCIDEWLLKLAKKKKINIQPDVSEGGTTDALTISLSKGGVPTAVLGVPVRNLHTTTGLASLDDTQNVIKLLSELLKDPPQVCIT